jgi:mono/diheme cytochrome c family protein
MISFARVRIAGLLTLGALATSSAAFGQDAALVKKGEGIYTAQKCSTCHAIAGKGAKTNPLDGVGGKLSAADIKSWIVDPIEMAKKSASTKKPAMPKRYSNLPAGDLDALVAYMASLK